jgi:LemA protein
MNEWHAMSWLLAAALAVLVFWAVGAHKRLTSLRHKLQAQFAQLAAQLQQRHALVEPLLQAVGPACTEGSRATLVAAVHQAQAALGLVQSHPGEVGPLVSLAMAEQLLGSALARLQNEVKTAPAAQEHPPELPPPAWAELIDTQARLDAQVVFARQLFNQAVSQYNEAVMQYPTRLLTVLFRMRPSAPLLPEPAPVAGNGHVLP